VTAVALAFAGGLAGSLHCLGMCGGLAALLGGGTGSGPPWLRLGLYNVARVNTYAALGAVAGALGTAVVAWVPLGVASRALAIVGGLAIVAVGLQWLGVLASRGEWLVAHIQREIAVHARGLLETRSRWTPVAFGTANAFLPCHLVYAFVAMAAATGSVGRGALTMLAFGLGTVPAMMLAGSATTLLRGRAAAPFMRVAGAFVLAVGIVTIARAFGPLGHAHH
jgi:sulfite exporter TauE/SafE